ncbi:hypothetical protein BDB00DRAFT_844824 [Zychaea mexicana]|uniref:uncharacterized protein n=1 Tax=Zychaea mexicana TaxID=64656 RepID=UPI0022FDC569|nr:uncharacterized protein BDB00DRAFT_844824 [Zychaea mexicana]KAI9489131.1 hypothetical protein BDB00DRAFT_844824 [Zychaea mexicana]
MEIGKRPSSRQRRQLPIAFESSATPKRHSEHRGVLPYLSSSTTTESSNRNRDSDKRRSLADGDDYDYDYDQSFMERSSSRNSDWAGHLRRRRKGVRHVDNSVRNYTKDTMMMADHDDARRRQRQRHDMLKESKHQMLVQVLIWASCGGWALFLLFRIVCSIWLGDYEQLNIVHFLTH